MSSARSTGAVMAGVVILGIGTYVYLAMCARGLELTEFARLSVVVTAVITVGPGLFLPIEQETARGIAQRLIEGISSRPLALKALQIGTVFAAVASVVTVGAGWAGINRLLDGDVSLLLALTFGVASLLPAYLSRGILAGSGHTGRYGLQLCADGVLRGIGAGGLYALGIDTPWIYAGLLTVAPLAAVALSVVGLSASDVFGTGQPRPAHRRELLPVLGYLVGGSVAMQALANGGPVAVKLISGGESADAGRFMAALVLARSPLFIVSALQATLVPSWAAMVTRGERRGVTRQVAIAAAALSAIIVTVLPIAALAGPAILRLIYGDEYVLSRLAIALLVAGAGMFCVAVIVSIALVAVRRPAAVFGGWVTGLVVFALLCAAPWSPNERVAVALTVGAVAAMCSFVLSLRKAMS